MAGTSTDARRSTPKSWSSGPVSARAEASRRAKQGSSIVKELTRVFAPEAACMAEQGKLYNSKSRRKVSLSGRCFIVCSVIVTVALGPAFLQGCSKPSEPQQTKTQPSKPTDEQSSQDADAKAWAEASRVGTAAALTAYLETHGSGAHAVEARQRLAGLEEQARKDVEYGIVPFSHYFTHVLAQAS